MHTSDHASTRTTCSLIAPFLSLSFSHTFHRSEKSELEKRSNINWIRLIFAILEDQLDKKLLNASPREMRRDKKRWRKAGNSVSFVEAKSIEKL